MNKEQHIQEIMNNFDWVKVQRVMQFMNWKWHGSDNVPTIHELMGCVKSLIDGLKPEYLYNSTGGFEVAGNEKDGYRVLFRVEEWETSAHDGGNNGNNR